ncbi:class I SAM-dependent methyltransferase [Halalkalicoccus subterraneus]|uniref:class I SAM-dependent methyltransferase n=1 Tax=Halalkalicoccus subterraneus TaxID=2675002 RepID=UPI000EFA5C58|nr:class I SAM-dependent methyltransferase [Halalkalicoccus subterraneus]
MADAFGRMVEDYRKDRLAERSVYRRDDGHVSEAHLEGYFADYDDWSELDRWMVERVSGSVLDLGCGVGRTALWAQERGHATVGIDRSPGAIRVVRERGVERALIGDLGDPPLRTGFDTLLVIGQQLGLGRSRAALEGTLSELARVTEPGGKLVADLSDPTGPDPRAESEYLDRHAVERGLAYRRFRVEYDGCAGPWIDLLMASPDALAEVVAGTPWTAEEILETDSSAYGVVLNHGG